MWDVYHLDLVKFLYIVERETPETSTTRVVDFRGFITISSLISICFSCEIGRWPTWWTYFTPIKSGIEFSYKFPGAFSTDRTIWKAEFETSFTLVEITRSPINKVCLNFLFQWSRIRHLANINCTKITTYTQELNEKKKTVHWYIC